MILCIKFTAKISIQIIIVFLLMAYQCRLLQIQFYMLYILLTNKSDIVCVHANLMTEIVPGNVEININ